MLSIKKIIKWYLLPLVIILLLTINPVQAVEQPFTTGADSVSRPDFNRAMGDGGSGGSGKLDNPINANNIVELVGLLVGSFFDVIGAAAFLFIIIGGFLMVTAAGDDEKIERGKNILLYTAVGLGLLVMSYVIIKYVIVVFTGQ